MQEILAFSFWLRKTSARQLATLGPSLLGLRSGLGHGHFGLAMVLLGGALALHGCRLLGSCSGLLQLELQPILMEDGSTHLE